MKPNFSAQEHGGAAALGPGAAANLLDLSVNVNPYGPPPGLLEKLHAIAWWHYPDPQSQVLKKALAESRQVSPEEIALGNGANEILWALARAFLQPGSAFTCLEPCYSEFHRAALTTGARPAPYASSPEAYARGLVREELFTFLETEGSAVLYLCNPNSPTGAYIAPEFITALAVQLPDLLIILDESFLSLSSHHARSEEVYPPNVLRVVSLTKDFALAGLRLGYGFGSPDLIRRIKAEIPSWSVNSLAQEAGFYCLKSSDFLSETRARLLADREGLEHGLRKRNIEFLPSSSVFLMFRPPGSGEHLARNLFDRHQILIRACSSYGWPDWLRIAARSQSERERFFHALDRELS